MGRKPTFPFGRSRRRRPLRKVSRPGKLFAPTQSKIPIDPTFVRVCRNHRFISFCPPEQFWFACEGLKRQWTEDPDKAVQIIQVIHKKYIRPRRVNVTELNRREINDRVANKATLDAHIFDEAQKDVEDLIRNSVYANFLNSDVYLSYIQVRPTLSVLNFLFLFAFN